MSSVTIRTKAIANNKLSLFIDFYPPIISPKTGQSSRREFLNLHIFAKPKNVVEKASNKTTLEFAESVRAERVSQIRNKKFGLKENIKYDIDFINYFKNVVDEYENTGSKGNHCSWKAGFEHFRDFAGKELYTSSLSPNHIKGFRNHLLTTNGRRSNAAKLSRNTASTYYNNFLAVLKRAEKENLIDKSLLDAAVYIKEEETYREYLTEEELEILWNTEIKLVIVKHMALFAALTGLRFSDIENLSWENVYDDKHQGIYIKLKEKKTGNLYNHPIAEKAFSILKLQKTVEGKIFGGFKYSLAYKPLKNWIKAAGITKKISFHNFRHSYATLQLANGTDIYTVSKLLGHKDIKTTQIYAKVIDENKIKAANNIELKLNGL